MKYVKKNVLEFLLLVVMSLLNHNMYSRDGFNSEEQIPILFDKKYELYDIQNDFQKFSHTVYIELLGSSILYSVNYELSYSKSQLDPSKVSLRVGVGGLAERPELVVGGNFLIGKNRSFLEVGINKMFDIKSDKDSDSSNINIGVGYRLHGYNGFFFHFIPGIVFYHKPQANWEGTTTQQASLAIGIGYTF